MISARTEVNLERIANALERITGGAESSATKQYGKTAAEWYQEYAQVQNEIKVLQSKLANAEATIKAYQEDGEWPQTQERTHSDDGFPLTTIGEGNRD